MVVKGGLSFYNCLYLVYGHFFQGIEVYGIGLSCVKYIGCYSLSLGASVVDAIDGDTLCATWLKGRAYGCSSQMGAA